MALSSLLVFLKANQSRGNVICIQCHVYDSTNCHQTLSLEKNMQPASEPTQLEGDGFVDYIGNNKLKDFIAIFQKYNERYKQRTNKNFCMLTLTCFTTHIEFNSHYSHISCSIVV